MFYFVVFVLGRHYIFFNRIRRGRNVKNLTFLHLPLSIDSYPFVEFLLKFIRTYKLMIFHKSLQIIMPIINSSILLIVFLKLLYKLIFLNDLNIFFIFIEFNILSLSLVWEDFIKGEFFVYSILRFSASFFAGTFLFIFHLF